MSISFLGIEIGKRSLQANQAAINVTGNNIANAATPGYSRQEVLFDTAYAFPHTLLHGGDRVAYLGTGVNVDQIRRMRDEYIDGMIRNNLSELSFSEGNSSILSRVEALFLEPSENGLQGLLTEFWNSWQELSVNPQDRGLRLNVREKASALTDEVNLIYRELGKTLDDLESELEQRMRAINELAGQLAQTNSAIKKSGKGDNNSLLDKRDQILEQLSQLVKIEVEKDASNSEVLHVRIGGQYLVEGEVANQATSGWLAADSGGIAGGLLAAREKVEGYRTDLENLAATLVQEVNAVHQDGVTASGATGVPFFRAPDFSPGANLLGLSDEVLTDAGNIAAALIPDAPGDGRNALAIAQLRDKVVGSLGSTFEGYYRDLLTKIGSDSRESARQLSSRQLVGDELSALRQSFSGVSLDEELANMLQYQYAYQASARLVSTVDEMLDTLINRIR
ncbi:MAG: flagellar hook-associated protein FlgK [Peptococcaceae bacterium]|nr:MAG: flagellar hook-associated protein FlgK [Peptococcaceae bacterium]